MKKVLLLTITIIFLASCSFGSPLTEYKQEAKDNICYGYSSSSNEYG
jgi:hypothetical protein